MKVMDDTVVSLLGARSTKPKTAACMFRIFRQSLVLVLSLVVALYIVQGGSAWFILSIRPTSDRNSNWQEVESIPFDWAYLSPSEKLVFTPCYEEYQCARLEVPMNWKDPLNGNLEKVVLAITKLPAKVHVSDSRYGGAIFINPGGPGGHGVKFVLDDGKRIQTVVDAKSDPALENSINSNAKYYDIISFDPRGVGKTTPGLNCFPDSFTRNIWDSKVEGEGMIGSSDTALDYKWARYHALGTQCSGSGQARNVISQYMNTASVVLDMAEMVERLGEWRDGEVRLRCHTTRSSVHKRDEAFTQSTWERGQEKLLYWGFSYGTVLGSTFAAMQPHRVGRMILDGVVNTENYYNTAWMNLDDADAVMDKFFWYCHEAGPERCAMYSKEGPADIQRQLEELVASIRRKPLPITATDSRGPEIITYTDIMTLIERTVYSPLQDFNKMAHLLSDLRSGSGHLFATHKYRNSTSSCPSLECRRAGPFSDSCQSKLDFLNDARYGIACSDGIIIIDTTREEFQQYLDAVKKQSRWIGDVWADIFTLPCIHWKARPQWTFKGPISGNTSFPIFFIGNTHDPVTPLSNAHIMSARFPGSMVLQQDSEGHCSISSPSNCTTNAVKQYFQTGTLPRHDTVCPPNGRPFGLPVDSTMYQVEEMMVDAAHVKAMLALQESFARRITIKASTARFPTSLSASSYNQVSDETEDSRPRRCKLRMKQFTLGQQR